MCYKDQKHFNQSTMSLIFCVILFYMFTCTCICPYQVSYCYRIISFEMILRGG